MNGDALRAAAMGGMRRAILGVITALTLALAAIPPVAAETRVALVIGNSAYKHAPALTNPKNDAEGMAASLKRLGFEVLAGTDLEKPAMDKLLQAFADKLEKADVALVFYAGHGLQVGGRNYLVPVDGKLDKESDLVFQAVALDTIQGLMEQGQRTSIMILDACRDNPLARNLARTMGARSTGIGRGLGATQAGVGTLIVYATQPGNVALDGDDGKNSPFTAALLTHLETKGLEVRQVLTRVRQAVIEKTRGKQVPWDSSSLTGDFFFVAAPGAREAPPAVTPPAPGTTPPAATETPRGPSADSEVVFWQSIKDSKNAADFKDYLVRWPSGTFAELAKRRLAELERSADVTPPAPTPEKPAPQPVAPAKPQRTSTFDVGLGTGGAFLADKEVASARACQAHCLANLQCNAWQWGHDEPENGMRRVCRLYSTVGDRGKQRYFTSGVIRTTPAAASAQPGTAPPAVPAPSEQQGLIREVMKQAESKGRLADGACLRAKWPSRSAYMAAGSAKIGGIATYTSGGDNCGVVRVTGAFKVRGSECRRFDYWHCIPGICYTDNGSAKKACMQPGGWEPYYGSE